ncbi:MAG: ABC-F family ATP-binding cassette domain-containing protein [Elusimicrobiota bacterium]
MITLRNIHKEFGNQTIFEDTSLQINDGDRLALTGPNGAGKSTLFRMLLGQVMPDRGQIQIRRDATIGYLPQEHAVFSDGTVLGETLNSHDEQDDRAIAKAKTVLSGLGFGNTDWERPIRQLSGGWSMRVAIARALVQQPDLLLLDEPTNHLDLDSLLWLRERLGVYPGAIFLISHDRAFMNAICQSIVNVQDHTLRAYHGDYEHFVALRQAERERLQARHRQQQIELERMQEFIDRNRARASTAGRAQSMIKRMEKIERIELPIEARTAKIRFPQPERAGARPLALCAASKSYGPVRVYEGLDFSVERGWKIAFVGHNGAGKSTLLKMLAGVLPLDSGERRLGLNVKTGYYTQHRTDMLNLNHTVLEEAFSVTKIGQTTTFIRTVLGTFLFPGETVHKKVSILSGGEKSRLALIKLLLNPPNVLFLDEPTTHLDIASVDALIDALKDFDGTLCFISHDLHFINTLATHIIHVDGGRVAIYPGNYEYFQRRQDQIKAEGRLQDKTTPALQPKPEVRQSDPKQQRRERALWRETARREENLALQIAALQKRIAVLGEQYADPSVHADFSKMRLIGDEIQSLQQQIEGLKGSGDQRPTQL